MISTRRSFPSFLVASALAVVALGSASNRLAAAQTARLPAWPAPPPTIPTAPAASSTTPAAPPLPLPPLPPPDEAQPQAAPGPPAPEAPPLARTAPKKPAAADPDGAAHDGDAARDPAADEADATPATPDPWVTSPFGIEAQLGLGAPLGFAGIAVDYSPAPVVSFNLGAGLSSFGAQLGVATRFRVVRFGHRAHFAPFVGAGLSLGPDSQGSWGLIDGGGFTTIYKWTTAYWANFETGMEMRFGAHTELRPFVGLAALLNPGDRVAVSPPATEPVDEWTLYCGIAVGYATGF